MLQTPSRTAGLSIRQILPEARIFGAEDIRITSCCGDSRSCEPGDLFVAITGPTHDGHDYIRQAVERGAAALLTERPIVAGVPLAVVNDTRAAYGKLCQAMAGNPTQRMRTYGVTGTHGKTVTAMLLAAVHEAGGRGVGFTSTLGHSDGVKCGAAPITTPKPPELATWLARMAANGCSDAVIELSSAALGARQAEGLELDAAVLTNIRREHLKLHGSVENYRKIKTRIFNQLKPHGFAVVNADDARSQRLLGQLQRPTITIGIHAPAEISATVLERTRSDQTFLLKAGHESAPVRTTMIGDGHIYNCLSAAAVGLVTGLDLPTVVRGLERITALPGRLERLECGQPFGVFVDTARTADGLAAALRSLRRVTQGRLICVYGADAESSGPERAMLGRIVERAADYGIVTRCNAGSETALQIAHDILDGYEKPSRAHVLPDRAEAIFLALEKARPGDTVLIAGGGQLDPEALADAAYPLDDREVARAWLFEVGAQREYEPARTQVFKITDYSKAGRN